MKNILQIFCIIQITLMFYAAYVAASCGCGGCMSNGIACLNEVEFTTCYMGKTTQNLISCNENERCTASNNICEPKNSNVTEICPFTGPCNICTHSNGRFACVDETHYGFCFGRYTPDLNTIRECPENFVCSTLAIKEICVPADHHKPSCISTTNSIRTTEGQEANAENNQEFLKNLCVILGEGLHGYPGNCKRYMYCMKMAKDFNVQEFECPPEFPYFNNQSKSCQVSSLRCTI